MNKIYKIKYNFFMKKNKGHKLEEDFIKGAKNIKFGLNSAKVEKVFSYLNIEHNQIAKILKNKDSDAKYGKVEDVTIIMKDGQIIRFSLKKDNKIVRHSRPQNILKELAYMKLITAKNQEIIQKTYEKHKNSSYIKISQLTKQEKYNIYEELRDYIFNELKNKINAAELFEYLLGQTGYNLLIYKKNNILLKRIDYTIPKDLSVKIERYNHNKIMFYFSNGCHYEYRLKTEGQKGVDSILKERFKGEFKIEKDIFSVEIIK